MRVNIIVGDGRPVVAEHTSLRVAVALTDRDDHAGTKDAYLTEGGKMVRYTITDPKVLGAFVQAGDLINLEGQLGTYKTVQEAAGTATSTPSWAAATTTT
jgi:hypothetical protein